MSASSTSRSSSPDPLAAFVSCLARSLCTTVPGRFGDRGDSHRLVVQFADTGRAMRRDFPVGVEAELRTFGLNSALAASSSSAVFVHPSAGGGRCSSPGWQADRRRHSPRASTACRAACAAPAASRSKFPRISCAVHPSGTSPANVIDRVARSTARMVRTMSWFGRSGSKMRSGTKGRNRADRAPRPRRGNVHEIERRFTIELNNTLPLERVIRRRGPNSSQPPALPWPIWIASP